MFLVLPVGVEYQARRHPVVTYTLMGICTLVWALTFAAELKGGEETEQWVYDYFWLTPSLSHWWTYLTSIFVHGGFFHLLGNMIYLYLFGACVEDLIGRLRFTAFFLVGGLVAALTHIAISPSHFASEVPMGGASGAINACIGGFVLFLAKSKIEFKWIFFFMFRLWTGEFFLPAWVVISFRFGMDLLAMILNIVGYTFMDYEESSGVAVAAHVGGFLCGLGWMTIEKKRIQRAAATEAAPEFVPRTSLATGPPAGPDELPVLHLFMNGQQSGPFTPSQVSGMLALGALPSDALYWQEGMSEWRTVEELRGTGGT